jgi:hypothetical protein
MCSYNVNDKIYIATYIATTTQATIGKAPATSPATTTTQATVKKTPATTAQTTASTTPMSYDFLTMYKFQ